MSLCEGGPDPDTDEDQIIDKLRRDAKAGNVPAAKELREWMRAKRERDQGAESIDTATTYSQLSHAQRLELRARLLGEYLQEDELLAPAQGEGEDAPTIRWDAE